MLINNPEQLHTLIDLIHDWSFDLNGALGNQEGDRICLEFREKARHFQDKDRPEGFFLTTSHIRAIEVFDTERIGVYPLNTISFDPEARVLSFNTSVPLTFKLHVVRLKLELQREHPVAIDHKHRR